MGNIFCYHKVLSWSLVGQFFGDFRIITFCIKWRGPIGQKWRCTFPFLFSFQKSDCRGLSFNVERVFIHVVETTHLTCWIAQSYHIHIEIEPFTVCVIPQNLSLFRWFKFTLKPPYSIAHDKLWLAIWDTSFWTFWLKFGHKGPWDIS